MKNYSLKSFTKYEFNCSLKCAIRPAQGQITVSNYYINSQYENRKYPIMQNREVSQISVMRDQKITRVSGAPEVRRHVGSSE
jgi:hypothetical protein